MTYAKWFVAPALVLTLVGTTGCATKKYVRQETQAVHTRVDGVETSVEQAQTRMDQQDQHLAQTDRNVTEASRTAQEALQRATEAGKLAQGKLLYETVLTDEKVKFGFDKKELSPEARAALDEFAGQLKEQNRSVYVEIQGHTDNVGGTLYNEDLGLSRAEAVRRYLNQQHGFPLHRINVISYGETAAVADNKTRDGRAQNRRVALVVLE
jgi:peptidoglycan-associated lipoprotein